MRREYILIILLLLILTGCNKKIDEASTSTLPSELRITAGDIIIKNEMLEPEENENVFRRIIQDGEVIPYLELGSKINIEFENNIPDTVKLYDYILKRNGNMKYDSRTIDELELLISDEEVAFELSTNFAAMLSSNMDDYKPGATIRGFRVVCTWGEEQREYGFIVRSDAN